MIDLSILKTNPELADSLTFAVGANELAEFAEICFNKGLKKRLSTPPPEEYLTPSEYAKELKISLVTLWNWDKKGITKPLKVGKVKRYRRSDLEKILQS